jgi:DNA modification methylase
VTSPPFYGLRDYGTGQWEGGDEDCDHSRPPDHLNAGFNERYGHGSGERKQELRAGGQYAGTCPRCGARRVDRQIGLEATPDEWVASLVAVFRECRRLLRPAGVMWVECGDSYAQYDGQGNKDDPREEGMHGSFRMSRRLAETAEGRGDRHSLPPGRKRKDLLGQPWMLAFALRADGWYLRQCVIWHKSNAMPESVRDRCTTAHSYVFLLSKSPRYWFDADAIAEPPTRDWWAENRTYPGIPERKDGGTITVREPSATRNARSVWTIPTSGYPDAHFATFPEQLVERMLKAGCPEWVCASCGTARERITDGASYYHARDASRPVQKYAAMGKGHGGVGRGPSSNLGANIAKTIGWSDCGCGHGFAPGTVLDPFMGSGTTALVARRLGRKAIGVELSPAYAAMAARRTQQLSVLA